MIVGAAVCTHLSSSARVLLAPMTVSRSLPSRAVLTVFIKCWRESTLSTGLPLHDRDIENDNYCLQPFNTGLCQHATVAPAIVPGSHANNTVV